MAVSFRYYSPEFVIFAGSVVGFAKIFYSTLKNICLRFPEGFIWAVPLTLFLMFQHFLWPAVETILPGTAYKYGTMKTQNRILTRQLRVIQKGDSWRSLHKKMPYFFQELSTSRVAVQGKPVMAFDLKIIESKKSSTGTNVLTHFSGDKAGQL